MVALTWIALIGLLSPAGNFGVGLAILLYWLAIIKKPSLYEKVKRQKEIKIPVFEGTPLDTLSKTAYSVVRASYLFGNAPIYQMTAR